MRKSIYINLPISNIEETKEFFSKLGFKFNPDYTNNDALCMILEDNIFVMLIVEKRFTDFTKKQIADAKDTTECINCLMVESREKVDQLMENVLEAGGKESRAAEDHGWMYGRSFEDLNGHLWEVSFMDETKRVD